MHRTFPILLFVFVLPLVRAASPLPALDSSEWQPRCVRFPVGDSKSPISEPPAADADPLWRFGFQYFQGTTNRLGEILTGTVDIIAQNGLRFTAARVVERDLWDLPVDVLVEGGVMWHNEMSAQADLFQYTLGVKFEFDDLPWSEHLRTRVGFTTGVSYAEHIPAAEQQNRGEASSAHLLHYLDFTLAFHCADLSRLTGLERLFANGCTSSIDHVWLTIGIPHRSGAWGLYGDDTTGKRIEGGSNYLAIGLEADF